MTQVEWVRLLSRACVVLLIGGLCFATFFSTLYMSRLKRMVEYLKGRNRAEWRRLGSPDVPLMTGFSRESARKVFRFVLLGPPSVDKKLESQRVGVRTAFIVFFAASIVVFVSVVAVPVFSLVAMAVR